jgi:hypothetical protein
MGYQEDATKVFTDFVGHWDAWSRMQGLHHVGAILACRQ